MRTKILCFLLLWCYYGYAQRDFEDGRDSLNNLRRGIPDLSCTTHPTGSCNIIHNSQFSTTGYGLEPFNNLYVSNWYSTHGNAQLNVSGPSLPGVNHASMWANYNGAQNHPYGEGILSPIPSLQIGHNYNLSFFKRVFPQVIQHYQLDEFYVYLLTCDQFQTLRETINTPADPLGNIPPGARAIYCETGLTNTSFQRVSQCFMADAEYRFIWIFPKQLHGGQWWVEVGMPELIDVTNFSAGTDPVITYPNCNVTIGPASPNCGPSGAIFTWYPPNQGTPIIAGPSQQIVVDASIPANIGTWTLKMTLPNTVTTTNTCSEACVIEDQVLIRACTACAVNVTPAGPIDYYLFADSGPWGRILTSSSGTGNQWYYNGNVISGATAQTYKVGSGFSTIGSGDYYVINNGCTSNIVHVEYKQYGYGNFGEDYFDRLGAKVHPIQTTNYYCYNTNNNSIQQFNLGTGSSYIWNFYTQPMGGTQNISLSPGSYNINSNQAQLNIGSATTTGTWVQGIANLNGSETIIDYSISLSHPTFIPSTQNVCQNAGQNISNWNGSSYSTIPGSSGFDWEQYDFGVNGVIFSGPGAGSSSVLIAGRSTPQTMVVKFTGPSFVQKHFYYNYGGCYKEEYNVTINPGCKSSNIESNVVALFPNPASASTTVSSSIDVITKIEIFDLMNLYLKTININKQKSVNINLIDLKPGIYNCRITTDKGVQNQKLVIKR